MLVGLILNALQPREVWSGPLWPRPRPSVWCGLQGCCRLVLKSLEAPSFSPASKAFLACKHTLPGTSFFLYSVDSEMRSVEEPPLFYIPLREKAAPPIKSRNRHIPISDVLILENCASENP